MSKSLPFVLMEFTRNSLSVLYRPITIEGQRGRYDIEPYNGKINDEFKMIPSGVAYGAMVFFLDYRSHCTALIS